MTLFLEERPSDSPYIETVWRGHSESAGSFTSRATSHGEIVLMRYAGYFDQPHLTRSLKHQMGITPAQISRLSQPA